ncbi:hypothetical protein EON67_04355 [archaeon]|nr:MAG: hypothetical protein EON67_04355 [archaeon]
MGQIVANDRDSYQYLVESIRKFPNQETFANMMRDANFQNVTYTNLTFGVCAVHSGFKWKTPSPALEPVAVSESGSSAGGGAGAGTLV